MKCMNDIYLYKLRRFHNLLQVEIMQYTKAVQI